MLQPQILFISHDASRTGAPIVFLNFLRWFKDNTDIPFQILLRRGGELEPEFAALAPTLVYEQNTKHSLLKRAAKRLGFKENPIIELQRQLAKANIGLIYSNTATNGELLQALSHLNCPVISHIHELEYTIQLFGITEFEHLKKQTTHFIACSQAVKTNLVTNHHISPADIKVIHEFIPIVSASIDSNADSGQFLQGKLNLSNNALIVGASGTTDWRKGTDLFIQLAYRVHCKLNAPIHFVWLGGGQEQFKTVRLQLQYDISQAGLTDWVHFIDSQPNPLDYFASFDLFALMSREDPYPLVCLEAASLGKPILCFDKAGGEPEFVEDDCGFIVPYLDIEVMADRIIELYQSPHLRQQLGQNAAQKVRDRHRLEDNAPKVLEAIKKYLLKNTY